MLKSHGPKNGPVGDPDLNKKKTATPPGQRRCTAEAARSSRPRGQPRKPCTLLHLRLFDGRLFISPVLAGACQFGTAWAGLRTKPFIHSQPRKPNSLFRNNFPPWGVSREQPTWVSSDQPHEGDGERARDLLGRRPADLLQVRDDPLPPTSPRLRRDPGVALDVAKQ